MSDVYDLGHLYRFMQAVSAASRAYGSPDGRISLSIHCEQPEIIRTMIDEVKAILAHKGFAPGHIHHEKVY